MQTVSIRLKELRKEKGLTQKQVAKGVYISRTAYTHYETGRYEPNIDVLKRLLSFYGVTADTLLTDS
jgi:transcriptional regulator with XRE-family HTH domain